MSSLKNAFAACFAHKDQARNKIDLFSAIEIQYFFYVQRCFGVNSILSLVYILNWMDFYKYV